MQSASTLYAPAIQQAVYSMLSAQSSTPLSSSELEQSLAEMSKVQVMDAFLASSGDPLTREAIWNAVYHLFGFDLNKAPILSTYSRPKSVSTQQNNVSSSLTFATEMEQRLNEHNHKMSGADIRGFINELFGINLDGLSALQQARISIYSKGQWVIHQDTDLIVIRTGEGDLFAEVFPTDYFKQKTGQSELPLALQQALSQLGYQRHQDSSIYSFQSETGTPIPDAFKGQTIGAIVKVIQQEYAQL
ncbi:hypothetical protein J2Z69_003058 [Paenibacillus shirakamiensis]|uniref:Uncharacterized protein n=1 Tax=Paenibacillus shirakamiensis TaxID=1265935 RepID=A0ABS4JJW7_9BACL|nr:hypothetical protein [Paenibacillus shirakamiensis]MBP2002002.1 hypothetical protein [Paenibacillus shirakamiensis]